MQRRLWQWLESGVLRYASASVFTTESAAKQYQSRYPAHSSKCHVIENGYDEEAFENMVASREDAADSKLLMLHSGLIYPNDRDPSTFLAAVRQLIDEGQLDAKRLCIRFRAPQHDSEVMACAERHRLADCVEIGPPIPYQRAIAEMMGTDLLLVFQGSKFNMQIPAKIYEYLRAGRPILAVVDPIGGTAVQLAQFEATKIVDIESVADIRSGLLSTLRERKTPNQAKALERNRNAVQRYSRQAQAASLQSLFNEVATNYSHPIKEN
jgi:glycosyltransferase involved in cell wall biosynthesis